MKRIVVAALLPLVAAISLASVASGGTNASKSNNWMTLAQAKHKIATEVVGVWTCDAWSGSPNYCSQDYIRSVSLRVLRGTIRGVGATRGYHRKVLWHTFLLNVTCGSDFRSGQQFHGRFTWEFNGTYFETTGIPDSTHTGRVYPGCTG
jgi:hypothetical protein